MLKKIIILLITLSLFSCAKGENNDKVDNSNSGVIIDNKSKVEKFGVGGEGDSSTIKLNGGFSN